MADGTAIDSTRMMGEIMPTQASTEKLTKATMKRLKGFDYSKPYFYMVTLKRVKGLRPFCEITKEKEPPSATSDNGVATRPKSITVFSTA